MNVRQLAGHRAVLRSAGFAVVALALAACGSSATTSGATTAASGSAPVKVGMVYEKTGIYSAYAQEYQQGFTIGLDYATGGTGKAGGHPVQVTWDDDADNVTTAVNDFKGLVGAGYKIIGGSGPDHRRQPLHVPVRPPDLPGRDGGEVVHRRRGQRAADRGARPGLRVRPVLRDRRAEGLRRHRRHRGPRARPAHHHRLHADGAAGEGRAPEPHLPRLGRDDRGVAGAGA